MDESRVLRHAGWAGVASVALFVIGVTLCAFVGVDDPGAADADILDRLDDGARQAAAGIGLPLVGAAVALLLWFAAGLRRLLDRISGGDPLADVVVPAAALYGGLVVTGVSLDVSSAITVLWGEFEPDADLARLLGTAGGLVAFTGLAGGAALVGATTRIAQRARALPTWAVAVSYVVAALCLSGFWSMGVASALLGLWFIGAVVGVLRVAQRITPGTSVPAPNGPPSPQRVLPRRAP